MRYWLSPARLCGLLAVVLLFSCGHAEEPSESSVADVSDSVDTSNTVLPQETKLELKANGKTAIRRTDQDNLSESAATFQLLLVGISRGPQLNIEARICPDSLWNTATLRQSLAKDSTPSSEVLALPAVRTESDGVASFPVPQSGTCVAVVHSAGRWTWQRLESVAANDLIPMRIPDEGTAAVRVVDQDGAPAIGVPITVLFGMKIHNNDFNSEQPRLSRAPDGGVFLSDMKAQRGLSESMYRDMAKRGGMQAPPPLRLFAYANILSKDDVVLELPLPIPTGTLEFKLPATGSLHLEVVGIDAAQGTVSISGSTGSKHFVVTRVEELQLQDGVLDIPFVGLGLDLSIAVKLDGESGTRSLSVGGPLTAGEAVHATLQIEASVAISGRLLDSRGNPITDDRVQRAIAKSSRQDRLKPPKLILFGDGFSPVKRELTLDEQGRFTAVLVDPRHQQNFHGALVTFAGKEVSWTGRTTAGVGNTDLGDLQLGAGATLFAGRVVDPQGNGIADARLLFQSQVEDRDGILQWKDYPGGTTHSTKDGRFRVPHTGATVNGRLIALHATYAQEQNISVTAGTMDNEVAMVAGGELYFTFTTPKGFRDWNLEPVLIGPSGEVPNEPESKYVSRELDSYRYRGLAPGLYTLAFRYSGFQDLIHPTEGVAIEAGQTAQDSRLEGIDVGLDLREIPFDIRDEKGYIIPKVSLRVLQGDELFTAYTGDDVSFWAPRNAQFHLGVDAEGFAPLLVKDVGNTIKVVLTKPQYVKFEVAAGIPLTSSTGPLYLALAKEIKESRFDYWALPWKPKTLNTKRQYQTVVPGPGRYILYWFPDAEDSENHFTTTIVLTESQMGGTVVVEAPEGLF